MSFLTVNGTLIVQLINFAIFFAVLNVVFLRPVASAIRRRREYINSLVTDYDRYQAEARSLRAQAQSIRSDARREAEDRVAATRAWTSNEAAELSGRYAQQAQAVVEKAQRAAGEEFEAARVGGDEAARRVADFMLDRVIPEAAK